MKLNFKKAFTLMEVNIAIFVMAMGILSMVSLYSLGYHEQSQGKEDVVSAATAESFIAPIVTALSSPELGWSEFNSIETTPEDGWRGYLKTNDTGDVDDSGSNIPRVDRSKLDMAFEAYKSANIGPLKSNSIPQSRLAVAMVVTHLPNSPIVGIAVRSGNDIGSLMSQPIYYTEVHFQGDPSK